MANRNARKKRERQDRRLRRLGFVFLGVSLTVLALVLIFRPTGEAEEPAAVIGDALWDGGWYDDDLGRVEKDRALVKGMRTFEKKTGVKPYLTLLDGIDPEELKAFARDQYAVLFAEGDHLLVVYDEWEEGTYYLAARTGAESALTDEDVSQLLTAIEKAYADPANETYADAFGAGFTRGARDIAARRGQGNGALWVLAGLGVLVAALAVILVLFLRKKPRLSTFWDGEDG